MPRKVNFLTQHHHEILDAARVALKHRNVTWDQEGWDAADIWPSEVEVAHNVMCKDHKNYIVIQCNATY